LNVWVYYHSQTVMETFQHQLPWCLRWCSRCIGGLRPQRHWLNRWWPYTKEQAKFHPVQSKDVHTATLRLRQKSAYFFNTKPEFVMPSGNLFHVFRRDKYLSKSCQILCTGLFEMIVRVLTTCRTQYTWDRSTVIPRLTKIIRSGITFVSRNLR